MMVVDDPRRAVACQRWSSRASFHSPPRAASISLSPPSSSFLFLSPPPSVRQSQKLISLAGRGEKRDRRTLNEQKREEGKKKKQDRDRPKRRRGIRLPRCQTASWQQNKQQQGEAATTVPAAAAGGTTTFGLSQSALLLAPFHLPTTLGESGWTGGRVDG